MCQFIAQVILFKMPDYARESNIHGVNVQITRTNFIIHSADNNNSIIRKNKL